VTQRITDLDDPAWLGLFTGVRSSWFRLETLQQYDVDYEAAEYRGFLLTGHLKDEPGEWQRMITEHTQAGRQLRRVHVIEEPLTDYLRYELAVYELNQRAGEDIRVLPTVRGEWPDHLPRAYDFWVFDDADAWKMIYDDDGRFIASEQVVDPVEIAQFRRWRNTALARSIPLADYKVRAA
jgi:hypothetical protein